MRVHETGIPFNDPSGDRLRDWLGVDRDAFYDQARFAIVPMGFCFPGYDAKGGDLPPRKECALMWHDQVFTAMPQVKLLLAIGQYAQTYHLAGLQAAREAKSLTARVAMWRQIWQASQSPRYIPLPHPSWRNTAWMRKNPWFETDVLPFLKQKVKEVLRVAI